MMNHLSLATLTCQILVSIPLPLMLFDWLLFIAPVIRWSPPSHQEPKNEAPNSIGCKRNPTSTGLEPAALP
ncbi:hypothetical protein K432DRAFT_131486 [Lepidopterella palustris CBS 459.81]|uniref:Uncharacterized protein n=1 Tax=Lepidopterella palustris CBS 459.81 TaxID=1314670 RepID=A0A8E2JIV4_9PEZI|nr:hypothetical protein K432DRAFT_131486 [Lepidopterella palustris CBS 459.81]